MKRMKIHTCTVCGHHLQIGMSHDCTPDLKKKVAALQGKLAKYRETMLTAADAIRDACHNKDDTLTDCVITWPLYAELEARLRKGAAL